MVTMKTKTPNPNHMHVLRFDLRVTDGKFNAVGDEHPEIILPNLFPEPRAEVPTVSVCLSGQDALGLEMIAHGLEAVAAQIRRHAERLALVELRHAAQLKDATDPLEEYDTANDPPGPPPPTAFLPPKPKQTRRARRSKAELEAERDAAAYDAEAAGATQKELADAKGHKKVADQIRALRKLADTIAPKPPGGNDKQTTLPSV